MEDWGEEVFAEGAHRTGLAFCSEITPALQASQNVVGTSVTHSAIACATFMSLLHFDVICGRNKNNTYEPDVTYDNSRGFRPRLSSAHLRVRFLTRQRMYYARDRALLCEKSNQMIITK